jgi:Arc/MetJ family transcription regulator
MTKTVIDLDDALVAKAAAVLGTSTSENTVNLGLARVARTAAADDLIDFARDGGFDDLRDPEMMKGAWLC